MIVGLTGGYGSGKDVVAEFFINKGFQYISLSNFIRDECISDGIPLTRNSLIKKGNELRHRYGSWILAKMAVDVINPERNYVIGSIRNPDEVKFLRKSKNFHLVKVEAPDDLRLKRVNERHREEERYPDMDTFLAAEGKEMSSKDKENQNLEAVFSMASIVLFNKYKSKKSLFKVLEGMYSDLKKKEK
ncbi:MAG: hypothetical protein ACOCUR_02520 [Nanoarchaeota archaeon]